MFCDFCFLFALVFKLSLFHMYFLYFLRALLLTVVVIRVVEGNEYPFKATKLYYN